MGMQREADLIEQQIKMRGNAPGQPGGKWFVAALSELVPRLLICRFKKIFKSRGCSAAVATVFQCVTFLFLHGKQKTATIFFSLFFSFFIFLYTYQYINIEQFKKKSHINAHFSA